MTANWPAAGAAMPWPIQPAMTGARMSPMKAMRQPVLARKFKAAEDTADAGDPAGRQHQQHGGKPDQDAADRGRYGE